MRQIRATNFSQKLLSACLLLALSATSSLAAADGTDTASAEKLAEKAALRDDLAKAKTQVMLGVVCMGIGLIGLMTAPEEASYDDCDDTLSEEAQDTCIDTVNTKNGSRGLKVGIAWASIGLGALTAVNGYTTQVKIESQLAGGTATKITLALNHPF
jgi:hypothetical protein